MGGHWGVGGATLSVRACVGVHQAPTEEDLDHKFERQYIKQRDSKAYRRPPSTLRLPPYRSLALARVLSPIRASRA